ncbi:MAG: sulfite exporter TauE/SafE family protein [Polyangiaceae bacterium]
MLDSVLAGACAGSAAFGFLSSLHCAGMCGPIAGCATGLTQPRLSRASVPARNTTMPSLTVLTTLYQGARVGVYSSIGAVLGGVGSLGMLALPQLSGRFTAVLPWVLAAVLVASALGLTHRLGSLPLVGRALAWGTQRAARMSPRARAFSLGALTPLLPCGLLAWMYAAALVAGGPIEGALVMLSFALGTLPALLAVQVALGAVPGALQASWVPWIQRGLAIVAAIALVYRGMLPVAGAACH